MKIQPKEPAKQIEESRVSKMPYISSFRKNLSKGKGAAVAAPE